MICAGAPPLTSEPLCMSPTVPFNLSVHLSPLKEKGQVLISKLRFVAASYNLGIYIPVSPGYEFRGLPTVQNIGVNQELSQLLWPHPHPHLLRIRPSCSFRTSGFLSALCSAWNSCLLPQDKPYLFLTMPAHLR